MRFAILALAALLISCGEGGVSVNGANVDVNAGSGGYTLEVRATEAEQVYVVTAPDGRVVGGRAAGGQSALLDEAGMNALSAMPPPPDAPLPNEQVGIRMPGFELSVSGDEAGGEDAGRVRIEIGEQKVEVDASDTGAEGGERAHVRITGADEAAARDFIAKADELSPATQAEMLAELGLN